MTIKFWHFYVPKFEHRRWVTRTKEIIAMIIIMFTRKITDKQVYFLSNPLTKIQSKGCKPQQRDSVVQREQSDDTSSSVCK